MKISIGCDHGALALKNKLVSHLEAKGFEVKDFGTYTPDSCVGRNGTPEDVAKAMAYLADAEFVTGQVLAVNGGYVI